MFNSFAGAGLLLLALVILPALALLNINPFSGFRPFGDWQPKRGGLRVFLRALVRDELGAVTVTYYQRGAGITILGSTTPPTATQGSQSQKVAATVAFGVTADAQALITHNMGLDASAPGYFEPEVFWEPQSVTTYAPLITFDRTNTNVLKVNKPATDGPTTLLITIRRPGGPWS
jgi:hypothetical protein